MVKRDKRLKKGIQSLKEQIGKHFSKIEKAIQEKKFELGRYHTKEIDKSLIRALELKLKILETNDNSVKKYRKRLKEMEKELDSLE